MSRLCFAQDSFSALNVAALAGHAVIIQALIALGVPVNTQDSKDGWSALHLSAQEEGHADAVRLLLASGIDVNAQDKEGCTPLHWAACNGLEDVVELLLAAPAVLVNARNDERETPLSLAVREDHAGALRVLLRDPRVDIAAAQVR